MKYTPPLLPIDCAPSEATKKQLQELYSWYLLQIPIRISYLTNFVQATREYEAWQADYTPASLKRLSSWFATQVKTQKRTKEVMQAIERQLTFPVHISDYDITSDTLFLAFDIGMYFGEVMRINHRGLEWTLCLKPKNDVNFGSVVLTGIGKIAFNPNLICRTLSYSYAKDMNSEKNMLAIYNNWAETVFAGKSK